MDTPLPGHELPHVIPPHDSHDVFLDMQEMRQVGFDFTRPVMVWFTTGDGKTFRSKPTRLLSR